MGIGSIFGLVALVCNIVVLIHAFKNSTGQGFMCLCIPCYSLYYMFAKFEHPKKGLVMGGALGGTVVNMVCQFIAQPSGSGRSLNGM